MVRSSRNRGWSPQRVSTSSPDTLDIKLTSLSESAAAAVLRALRNEYELESVGEASVEEEALVEV